MTAKTVFFQKENTTMRQTEKKNPKSFGNMFSSTRPESSGETISL